MSELSIVRSVEVSDSTTGLYVSVRGFKTDNGSYIILHTNGESPKKFVMRQDMAVRVAETIIELFGHE